MEINILMEAGAGELDEAWLRRLVEQVLAAQGVPSSAEVGLVITGQERIRQLNRDYLGEDEPTDVLSFSMGGGEAFVAPPDEMQHLGEVLISYPQAVVQARERGHSARKEVAILVIHGLLHLLGYDHEAPETERRMRSREADLLKAVEDVGL